MIAESGDGRSWAVRRMGTVLRRKHDVATILAVALPDCRRSRDNFDMRGGWSVGEEVKQEGQCNSQKSTR